MESLLGRCLGECVRSGTGISSVGSCGIGILPMIQGLEGAPRRGIWRWGPQAHATPNRLLTHPLAHFMIVLGVVALMASRGAAEFQWETATPESQGMSSEKLAAMRDDLAARKTTGLLVVRNDKIVCEWYAPGQSAKSKHYTASMAKAVVGGVSLAVAMSDGLITLDDQAAKFIPQWRNDPLKFRITVRQLGSHTAGIEDAEADNLPHEKLTGWKGDFWKRLPPPCDPFTIARDDAPVLFTPGTKMSYSNPGIAMLTYAVTASLRDAPHPDAQQPSGLRDIRTLLRERVMRPIGVPDDEWSVGYSQTPVVDGLPLVGSWGGGNYTARAAARVGRLMLREGDWDGRRLISADAVRQVTRDVGTPGNCGIGWWSNNDGSYPELPRDAFCGSGAGHQIVLVVPSLNLIAVRNGENIEAASGDPNAYHVPLRRYLFGPLVNAIVRTVSAERGDGSPLLAQSVQMADGPQVEPVLGHRRGGEDLLSEIIPGQDLQLVANLDNRDDAGHRGDDQLVTRDNRGSRVLARRSDPFPEKFLAGGGVQAGE
jgi:CubicO group peptidase (beta-lactamase class C family)